MLIFIMFGALVPVDKLRLRQPKVHMDARVVALLMAKAASNTNCGIMGIHGGN